MVVTSTFAVFAYINSCSVRGSDPPATPSVRPHQSAQYCALWAPSAEGGVTQAPRCGDLPQVPKWPLENRVCSVRAHWLTSGRELGSASNDVGSTCSDVFRAGLGPGGPKGAPRATSSNSVFQVTSAPGAGTPSPLNPGVQGRGDITALTP